MSQKAAHLLIAQQAAKPDSVYLLPAGRTPRLFYDLLVQLTQNGKIDWRKSRVFMLDEYWEGEDFRHYIQAFADRLPFNNRPAIHGLAGKSVAWAKEAHDYEQMILNAGGVDLCVIGVGSGQGHIGFNESGSSFSSRTRRVDLAPGTIETNLNEMERKTPPYDKALTVGIATILDSRKIIVLASGESKVGPIAQLLKGKLSEEYPITAVLLHRNTTVLVDSKAAPPTKELY